MTDETEILLQLCSTFLIEKVLHVPRRRAILNDAIAEMENSKAQSHFPKSLFLFVFIFFQFKSMLCYHNSNFILQFYNLGERRIGASKIT